MARDIRVDYVVNVNVGGFSLVLLSMFGDGRSINDLLIGSGEWAPLPQIEAFSRQEAGPFGNLFGGVEWGEPVEVGEWR